MAGRSDKELDRLRKTVAAYVRGLIALGVAAQRMSTAGGSSLAVSRLISSGVALASQLQRGIVVRVAGAPLLRRRARGRTRSLESDVYPEPPTIYGQDAEARDQEATEWRVVPPSLALAEIDDQPFALARALPSMVAAQQSTFRALSSVGGAVARAVGSTSFAPAGSRSSPSQTSLEPAQQRRPEAFAEGEGTSFSAETSPLAVSAAFRAAASSMAFNLSSAAHEMTNIALGYQAVGAGFTSGPSRVSNEGTSFGPSPQGIASPSLLQPAITGSVNTTFQSTPPSGANLGLVAGTGGVALPVSRESAGPSDLSVQVGGSSPASPQGGASVGSPSPSSTELNAGPYAVPNGFNSVLASPAFTAGTQLSMQVKSLASSGSSGQLPLRSSQEPSQPAEAETGMAVVPEQYPSSYPVGVAFSLSGMVASLGLGQASTSSNAAGAQSAASQTLASAEAPGMSDTSQAIGGSFIGDALEARESGGLSTSSAETPGEAHELGGEESGVQGPRTRFGPDAPTEVMQGGSFPTSPIFGGRWSEAIAGATTIGSAIMSLLTVSTSSPGGWAPGLPGAKLPGSSQVAGAPGSVSLPRAGMVSTSSGGVAVSSGSPELPLLPPAQSGGSTTPPRPGGSASLSTWEAVTLLPGVLTPHELSGNSATDGARYPSGATVSGRPTAASPTPEISLGALGSLSAGHEALRIATSLRTALLSASVPMLGAATPGFGPRRQGAASRSGLATDGVAIIESGGGTFVRTGTPGLARRVDRFSLTSEAPSVAGAFFPALQAFLASRAMPAMGVTGPLAVEAPSLADTTQVTRPVPGSSSGAAAPTVAGGVLSLAPSAPERDVEAILASLSREGSVKTEGPFFGLGVVAQALSLASRLPWAAQLHLASRPGPSRRAAQPKASAFAKQTAPEASSVAEFAPESAPPHLQDWRSAPEETLTRMLGEPLKDSPGTGQDSPPEADDRELRRRIEKLLDEELRRYGYQP